MSRKRLFTISLLLPLMAVSGQALAGPTVTDRNYWPNEVRAQTLQNAKQVDTDWYQAHASGLKTAKTPRRQATPSTGQQTCRYQGGPKLPLVCGR